MDVGGDIKMVMWSAYPWPQPTRLLFVAEMMIAFKAQFKKKKVKPFGKSFKWDRVEKKTGSYDSRKLAPEIETTHHLFKKKNHCIVTRDLPLRHSNISHVFVGLNYNSI